MERLCQNCMYWEENGLSVGICRRYPPRAEYMDFYPRTHNVDWCGEFAYKHDNVPHDTAKELVVEENETLSTIGKGAMNSQIDKNIKENKDDAPKKKSWVRKVQSLTRNR